MKFVIGWLTLKPGTRDEFMTLCRPFIAATREEEGVDFFEFHHDLGELRRDRCRRALQEP